MPGPFETAAKAAIEELIQTHAQASKFGYVLTHEGCQDLVRDLFDLLATSRSLKAAGDRMLAGGPVAVAGGNARSQRPKR